VLGRITEFSLYAAPALLACGEWLASLLSFLATLQGFAILFLICISLLLIAMWRLADDDPARN
jgi:hypothetical protein